MELNAPIKERVSEVMDKMNMVLNFKIKGLERLAIVTSREIKTVSEIRVRARGSQERVPWDMNSLLILESRGEEIVNNKAIKPI